MKNKKGGRPPGRKKTAKIEVSIEPNIKDHFMSLIKSEGETASGIINYWIRKYIKTKKNDI